MSWLSNRRDDKPFGGLIGVRFYCFEPIRPDAPVVAPDASRVRPDELWCSLLSQLRSGLRGRLHELQVPLRNEFLSWSQARDHVLRLANQLGSERGQKFVIVIDGIDHAARAVQTMPQQIAQFFASLPGPDDLKGKAIRLLIAGQPPEHYRDAYPTWLTGNHPSVRRIDLPRLNTADVRALYLASIIALPAEQIDAAIRVIEDNAQGNTLATVFAIAEAESTSTLVALQKQLSDRRLADGLESYYSQIWNHMLRSAGDFAAGLDSCLAGSISMARRGVPAELLATAFSDWNRPIPWWEALLQSLGPLLTQGNYGFRVRHNDVRVFLSARFAGCTVEQRRNVASCLANYYEKTSDDRLTAHLQLIDLLELAGRASEAASVFTVDWVLEAATLGIDTDKLSAEACTAVCGLPKLRRWNLVVSVACAIQTFDRLSDAGEFSDHDLPIELSLPPFLPSEAGIRPLALWKMDDLQGLTSDVAKLVLCGELSRAMALLQRWLNGVTLGQLIGLLPVTDADRMGNAEDAKTLGQTAQQVFKELGRLCGTLSWRLPIGDCRSDIRVQARFAFERGFVDSINANTNASSLRELFALYKPKYIGNWEETLQRLVTLGRWELVREALGALSPAREKLAPTFLAETTWWAIRSKAAEDDSEWLRPLELPKFGLVSPKQHLDLDEAGKRRIAALLNVARSIGYRRADLDPGDTGTLVFQAFVTHESDNEYESQIALLFRTAAQLGRLTAAEQQHGYSSVVQVVTAERVGEILNALWRPSSNRSWRFGHFAKAAELAAELSEFCARIGGAFHAVALRAAIPYAESFPIDCRMNGIWATVARGGNPELLQQWVRHWLGEQGAVWHLSRAEVHSVVRSLVRLGIPIGETELIDAAEKRLLWLPFGYRDRKEYGFGQVFEWFELLSKLQPAIWREMGWKLWCLCKECETQGGDNRYNSEILNAISAAAIRCDADDWWKLISPTLSNLDQIDWHNEVRARLVDGAAIALRAENSINTEEMLTIWCIATSLSFWTDKNDNSSLNILHDAIIQQAEEIGQVEWVRSRLKNVSQRSFADSVVDEPDSNAESVCEPTIAPLAETLGRIERGETIRVTEAADAIAQILCGAQPDQPRIVATILCSIGACSDYSSDWSFIQDLGEDSVARIARSVNDSALWNLIEALTRDLKHASSWIEGMQKNLLLVARLRAAERGLNELSEGLSIQIETHARWAFGNSNGIEVEWPALASSPGPAPTKLLNR